VRVLLVTRGFPPRVGGVERVCAELAAGLAAAGDEVTVLTFGGPGRRAAVADPDRRAPYQVVRVPSMGDTFEFSLRLARWLRRLPFDACHVHNLHSTVAATTWRADVRPYVLTTHYHGGGHTPAARLLHLLYRPLAARIVRDAARVTAVSDAEAALVAADFGVRPLVIGNGVSGALAAGPRPDAAGCWWCPAWSPTSGSTPRLRRSTGCLPATSSMWSATGLSAAGSGASLSPLGSPTGSGSSTAGSPTSGSISSCAGPTCT
jgi:hypothetical protein